MADSYLDRINRREVEIQAFANYLIKEYTEKGVIDAYRAARLALLDVGDITSRAKLNKIVAEINRSVNPIYSDMWSDITGELDNFGAAEAVFAAKTLSEFSPVNIKTPAKRKTQEYIQRAIMSLESSSSSTAGVWAEFTKNNTDKNTQTLISAVKSGYSNGETTVAITRRLKMASDGITKNGIETLIRTGTVFYSQQANNYMRDDNLDVLAGGREHVITTWDSRRSLICTSVEAKYGVNGTNGWPIGKSPIGYPAWHFGCRSKVVALPKGAKLEGERPAIEGRKGKEGKEAFERKTGSPKKYVGRNDKAFKVDQISVNQNLANFIINQPIFYQNQLLGKTRATALRNGELDLKKLTFASLKPRTLADLDLSE